jgi:nitroreductase
MDIQSLAGSRRSGRAFKKEAVKKEVVEELLGLAGQAPSAINLQPWEVAVVAGEELDRLKRRLKKAYEERKVSCGPGTRAPIPDKFKARQVELFQGMAEVAQGAGMDLPKFIEEGSLSFYGAPCALIFYLEEVFLPTRILDLGIALGYFFLAAESRGLATCPLGLILAYEEEIKDQLNIPEGKTVLLGVALGYRDEKAPINAFKSERIPLRHWVRWLSA